jgi:hypothetical protein
MSGTALDLSGTALPDLSISGVSVTGVVESVGSKFTDLSGSELKEVSWSVSRLFVSCFAALMARFTPRVPAPPPLTSEPPHLKD